MLGTIALTGYLYVVIPKGFFPQQDTGLIVGITEAAQDISFPAMAERQQALVDILLKDPAVASVGNYIGPGGPTATLNEGRMFIALKPQPAARCQRRPGDRPAAAAARQDPGHHALHAGGAGHHDRRAAVEDAVSIHADRRRFRRAQPLGGDLSRQAESASPASPTSPATRPMPARCSTSPSIARSPRASASCPRRSTTRSTTPSASASSRPSSPRSTSITSCSRSSRASSTARRRCKRHLRELVRPASRCR